MDEKQVTEMILEWAGSWSTSMNSQSLKSFRGELIHYPIEQVREALKKARADWEQAKHPHLQYVLDRLPSAEAPKQEVSGWVWDMTSGVELFGPNWDNPDFYSDCRESVLKIRDYLKTCQNESVYKKCQWLFDRFGVENNYSETRQFQLGG